MIHDFFHKMLMPTYIYVIHIKSHRCEYTWHLQPNTTSNSINLEPLTVEIINVNETNT